MTSNKAQKTTTLWLLMIAILMAPWLSFWTSPALSINAKGETVVVCTINGFMSLTLPAEPTTLSVDDMADICAAMQLADSLNNSPTPSFPLGEITPFPFTFIIPATHYDYRVPHVRVYASRAPPFLHPSLLNTHHI